MTSIGFGWRRPVGRLAASLRAAHAALRAGLAALGADECGPHRVEHGDFRLLLLAAAAYEAAGELGELAVAVDLVDVDAVQGARGVAEGAFDLQRAPEADEIAGRADMLVGHAPTLRA